MESPKKKFYSGLILTDVRGNSKFMVGATLRGRVVLPYPGKMRIPDFSPLLLKNR